MVALAFTLCLLAECEPNKVLQQALDTQAERSPRVIDPRTSAAYILVPETDYETMRELLDEEHRVISLTLCVVLSDRSRDGSLRPVMPPC